MKIISQIKMSCTCALATFISNCPHKLLLEIHKGAYVMIEDDGSLYRKLISDHCGSVTTLSSHSSDKNQYRCNEMFTPLLFGVKKKHTWFQFERHRPEEPMHCIDWCMYIMMNRNVGKDGTSVYTEKNPLYLKKNMCVKS